MYATLFRPRKKLRVNRQASARAARGVFEVLEPRWALSVGVLTYHNDAAGTGLNAAETALTPANVNTATFGKLFATALDGFVYAQPLVAPGLTIAAGPNTTAGAAGLHDVVFAATEHDSLYAIDADPKGTGTVLWQRSFTNTAVGYTGTTPGSNINNTLGAAAITAVPVGDTGISDVTPEIGITSTPVIDSATGTVYVMVKSKEIIGGVAHYVQRLHALNVADGTDRVAPFLIGDTSGDNTNNTPIYVYGNGDGSVVDPYNNTGKSVVQFNALRENQRAALSLVNNVVYVGWASHGDVSPYHGWVVGWNVANLASSGMTLAGVFNASPNGGLTGIWESGGRLAAEADGSAFYFSTGNGPAAHGNPVLDVSGFPTDGNYYDAVIKMVVDPSTTATSQGLNGWGLKVADYFMPYNMVALDAGDADLGSGGPVLLPDSAGISGHPHLLVVDGKAGTLYLIDRDNMGKFDAVNDHVVNAVPNGSGHNTVPTVLKGVASTPAFYNGTIYAVSAYSSTAKAFRIAANGTLTTVSQTAANFGFEPGSISVSSNGTTAGIVWVTDRNINQIHAYDAASFATELWNSGQRAGGSDNVGSVVKFAAPTVANGEVFVGTGNSLVVYGAASQQITISKIVVAESPLQNGILDSGDRGVVSWAVASVNPVVSTAVTIDGTPIAKVSGPFGPFSGSFYYSSTFGPLSAGTHSYVVRVTDSKGFVANGSGTFVVAPAAPVVSQIVIAESPRQNGILQSGEKGVISWASTSRNRIASRSLTVDSSTIATYGPFVVSSALSYFSGVFGPLPAGTHKYAIKMTDSTGLSGSATGTFVVAAAPPPVISLAVVAENPWKNGIIEPTDPLVITWSATSSLRIASQSVTVDGKSMSPIGGPISGRYYYCRIGNWAAGSHAYTIRSTDSDGTSSTFVGSFTVISPAIAAISAAAKDRSTIDTILLDQVFAAI
jgi:hypothetical protein